MDGVYAENAGAFFGGCLDGSNKLKRRSGCCEYGACMPEMQEQFPARASLALSRKTKRYGFGRRLWR